MAEKQKEAAVAQEAAPKKPKKKKSLFGRVLKYLFAFIFLVIIAACGALYWAFQTESGHAWLQRTANTAFNLAPGKDGIGVKLTSLNGSLPFNFKFGLELSDKEGIWLNAPDNTFIFNWRELPGAIHISAIKSIKPDINRLPILPPDNSPPAPSKPLTIEDVQKILDQASSFLSEKHWWLPDIRIENVGIENALLPAGIAGEKGPRMVATANAAVSFLDNRADVNLLADLGNEENGVIDFSGFSFSGSSVNLEIKAAPVSDGIEASANLDAALRNPVLVVDDVPPNLLGQNARFSLGIEAKANSSPKAVKLELKGPNLEAGNIELTGHGQWETGAGWGTGRIDGPLNIVINLAAKEAGEEWLAKFPDAPINILRSPLVLKIDMKGDLPRLDCLVDVVCAELQKSGHEIKNLDLSIGAKGVDLPLDKAEFKALENEHHINLGLSAQVDKENVNLDTMLFFQALPGDGENLGAGGWRAGMKDLSIHALGLLGNGHVAALLPPEGKPAIDGEISLDVKDWVSIARFMPGKKLAGEVKVNIGLSSSEIKNTGIRLELPHESEQAAAVTLSIPSFSMGPSDGGKPIVELASVTGRIDLGNIFGDPVLKCDLKAGKISAADMLLNAAVKAEGPIAGPLTAEISSGGSVTSKIAALWEPGKVILKTLDLLMDIPNGGKRTAVGIKSSGTAEVDYGTGGIEARNIDLKLVPSGRIRASGGFAPEKLDFRLNLESLDFKPWQTLAPQIPSGSLNLSASVNGTPQRPGGQFKVAVNDLEIPQASLPPVSLALTGGIEHGGGGSSLGAKLAIDSKTLKTLGATVANVTARVPLLFGSDGVPKLNMDGPLAANVKWEGAIGPIWNLLPIPDRRFNGRLGIDITGSGKVSAPRIRGGVSIDNGRYEDLLLGVLLTEINMKLNLADTGSHVGKTAGALDGLPGSMTLALNATDGRGGTIAVNGKGGLDGNGLDIKAKIDRLKPLRRRDVHVELSGNALVAGSATAPEISGELIVNQGEILLNNLALGGSVTTLPISNPEEIKKEDEKAATGPASKDKGNINFRITIPPRFSVEGRGLTSLWKANLLVEGSPFDPKITGNISSVRGDFDFLGKIFKLTKGIVFFGGGSLANPLLDMELTNETPDLTAHIFVTGPVDKMKLNMTSDPSLPRDDILSRVLFGRSINDLSRLEQLQLAAAVAELAGFGSGGGILNSAKKALGIDVLRLGSSSQGGGGEPGEQTEGGATIEMGKYINDMIYMGVQQGLRPDSTAFIIQLELTPRTSLEVRTEQNNTWGGLNWKYNY